MTAILSVMGATGILPQPAAASKPAPPRKVKPRLCSVKAHRAPGASAEEAERARQHYEDLYNFAPAGYVGFDGRGIIREINLAAAILLGQTQNALMGTRFVEFVTESTAAAFAAHLRRCKRGKATEASEIVIALPSGQLIPAQIISALFKTGGRILFRTIITDLTGRKRHEETLQHVHDDLEKRINERTAELVKANQELQAEIAARRRLEGEILEVIDREERRIGQLLHDGLCQHLAAVSFMAKAIAIRLEKGEGSMAREVDHLSTLLTEAVGQTRDLARGLKPVEADSSGLMAALQELAASVDGPMTTRFECSRPVTIKDGALALNLYRIAQEAISNAVKHSNGKCIDIQLTASRGQIMLSVQDDGAGLPQQAAKGKGMGMHLMDYRAKMIGASLQIAERASGGTRVACSIPARTRQ